MDGFPSISSLSIQKFCLGRILEFLNSKTVCVYLRFPGIWECYQLAATLNQIYCACTELYAVWKCHTGIRDIIPAWNKAAD